jgi:hypothetical protein
MDLGAEPDPTALQAAMSDLMVGMPKTKPQRG